MKFQRDGTVETMILEEGESTNIASGAYDHSTNTLLITFLNGGLYSYYAVPSAIWEALKAAESKGRYFQSSIKGYYLFKRLDK